VSLFSRELSLHLLRRNARPELLTNFVFTPPSSPLIATELFLSRPWRSEFLSKPLRFVRFEPYFPSSTSPRLLESYPSLTSHGATSNLHFLQTRATVVSPKVSTSSLRLSFRELPSSPALFASSQTPGCRFPALRAVSMRLRSPSSSSLLLLCSVLSYCCCRVTVTSYVSEGSVKRSFTPFFSFLDFVRCCLACCNPSIFFAFLGFDELPHNNNNNKSVDFFQRRREPSIL